MAQHHAGSATHSDIHQPAITQSDVSFDGISPSANMSTGTTALETHAQDVDEQPIDADGCGCSRFRGVRPVSNGRGHRARVCMNGIEIEIIRCDCIHSEEHAAAAYNAVLRLFGDGLRPPPSHTLNTCARTLSSYAGCGCTIQLSDEQLELLGQAMALEGAHIQACLQRLQDARDIQTRRADAAAIELVDARAKLERFRKCKVELIMKSEEWLKDAGLSPLHDLLAEATVGEGKKLAKGMPYARVVFVQSSLYFNVVYVMLLNGCRRVC